MTLILKTFVPKNIIGTWWGRYYLKIDLNILIKVETGKKSVAADDDV